MLQLRDAIWGLTLLLGCAAALQVVIMPPQGDISVGESKFFICEVVGDAKDIDWFDPNGEKILPDRQDIFINRNDETTSTLTIYRATEDNAGRYKCVARSAEGEAQATVEVDIFQRINFQNVPSPQEFNEGDDAEIVCEVVSSPQPTIIWKHKGSRIQTHTDVRFRYTSSGLLIRGIKKTDEGMYTCEARVMVRGELDFRMIKVIVNVLPTIRARQSEVNATADVGSSALLACDADGFPEPTVTWAHNKEVLQMGDKYSVNEDGSELTVRDVVKVDEGEYTCVANNKAGEKSQEVSLNVFVRATVTFLNNQTASEFDDEVTLTCEASGDPTPSISWSFNNRLFSDGEQSFDRNIVVRSHARVSSLTLKNVQFTYAGLYLCTASNAIGHDSRALHLQVRYAPKILSPVTVFTWEGNAANISCEVEAHPSASITWFRDGLQLPNANATNAKIYSTPTASYLEVTPDSQSDFGSYNCSAANAMGAESKEFLLIQADVPSSPELQKVEPFSTSAVLDFEEPDSFGGVPIIKYRVQWRTKGQDWSSQDYLAADDMIRVTVNGLKPDTTYEVRMLAINGKGEGESSGARTFTTGPIREPSTPRLEGQLQSQGNMLKVSWTKQDDGGAPIKHYLIRYKSKPGAEWKPEIRLPHGSEYVMLRGLDWNTDYEVHVIAENRSGKSKPGIIFFRTTQEPTTVPGGGGGGSGLGTGAIVGILMVVFLLLLVGVDVTCYFLNKCGLLMCIAVNVCGKSGPGAKSADVEEGKAAFTKDESKEPIVEVRAEETRGSGGGGGGRQGVGTTEPNETTPLTDPEPVTAADSAPTLVNSLPPTAANSVGATPPPAPAESAPPLSPAPPPAPSDAGLLVDLSDTPASSEPAAPPAANSARRPDSGSAEDSPKVPPRDSASTAHNDGKTAKDTKADTEAKNAAEVKTVPNEAPQMNGNESKA